MKESHPNKKQTSPKKGGVDLLVIGGIISVVLLVLAGIISYLRFRKNPMQPNSLRGLMRAARMEADLNAELLNDDSTVFNFAVPHSPSVTPSFSTSDLLTKGMGGVNFDFPGHPRNISSQA